jgi:hypothetical protein
MDESVDCEQILALTSAYGKRHGDDGAQELAFVVDYNTRREAEAKRLIADIQQGILKHHTIHCLSVTASFSNVTGLSIEEFGRPICEPNGQIARRPLGQMSTPSSGLCDSSFF